MNQINKTIQERGFKKTHLAKQLGISPAQLSYAINDKRTGKAYKEIVERLLRLIA